MQHKLGVVMLGVIVIIGLYFITPTKATEKTSESNQSGVTHIKESELVGGLTETSQSNEYEGSQHYGENELELELDPLSEIDGQPGSVKAYYLSEIINERFKVGMRQGTFARPVANGVNVLTFNGETPEIRKQVTVYRGSANHNVFSSDEHATSGGGGFRYNIEVVDVATSDPDNYGAEISVLYPSKVNAHYRVLVRTKRLKHIYKQKEPSFTVTFKLKTTYNYNVTKGDVSTWWRDTTHTTSEAVTVKIPANPVAHQLEVESDNIIHSPIRYQANFPNGSLTVPIAPFSQDYLVKRMIKVKFPDLIDSLSFDEAIKKDPALRYSLAFERNRGDNTYDRLVDVTTTENWQHRIPWDVLTNQKDSRPFGENDYAHKLTINITDQETGRVAKKTIPLSLVNQMVPRVSSERGHPKDIKDELTYVLGQTVPMSQILKDAQMTANNISDSWFPVKELSHYFYRVSDLEASGVLSIKQKLSPSNDDQLPGTAIESITMKTLGEQVLRGARISNPVGNDTSFPILKLKVVPQPDMKVIPFKFYNFNLGREVDPKQFISRVTIGGEQIPKSDYEVELIEHTPIIDEVNGRMRTMYTSVDGEPVKLKVTYKGNIPTKDSTQVVSSGTKVNWGQTAGHHSVKYIPNKDAPKSGVVSLLEAGGKLSLVSTFGDKYAAEHRHERLGDFDFSQSVVSLYGKDKSGLVNVAFTREETGENPTLSPNRMSHTAYGGHSIYQYQQALNQKLAMIGPAYGDVLAMGNRPLKDEQGNYVYNQGRLTKHATKWALINTASHNWSRHKTELYELTKGGLRHLVLNHFYNEPTAIHEISRAADLSSEKLLAYLGEHRDGGVDYGKLQASVDASKINWRSNEKQSIVVTVTEKLATGGHAKYEYDLNIRVSLKPITVKHVYVENKGAPLRTATVKDQVFFFDGNNDHVKVTAPDLGRSHYDFRQMSLDDKPLGNQVSQEIQFKGQAQTLYIQYSGRSWIEKVANPLIFKGQKILETQHLDHLDEVNMTIFVKSSAYRPNWSLIGRGTPFTLDTRSKEVDLMLIIDEQEMTDNGAVIHSDTAIEKEIVIGNKGMFADGSHKKATLIVGPKSYAWVGSAGRYTANLQWSLDTSREKADQTSHLPYQEGDLKDEK